MASVWIDFLILFYFIFFMWILFPLFITIISAIHRLIWFLFNLVDPTRFVLSRWMNYHISLSSPSLAAEARFNFCFFYFKGNLLKFLFCFPCFFLLLLFLLFGLEHRQVGGLFHVLGHPWTRSSNQRWDAHHLSKQASKKKEESLQLKEDFSWIAGISSLFVGVYLTSVWGVWQL